MRGRLTMGGTIKYIVSDITDSYRLTAENITGETIELEKTKH